MKERFKSYVAVYLILTNEKNEVCLLLRSNTNHKYSGKYTLISGHIDSNESVIDAMIREAREEANIIIKEKDLHFYKVVHRCEEKEFVDFYFTCDNWEGNIKNNEPHKHKSIEFYNLSKLPHNTTEYIKEVLSFTNHTPFGLYGW